MGYYVKVTLPCAWCGQPTTMRQRVTRKPTCMKCSIDRSVDNMHQQMYKRGPYYEKGVARLLEYLIAQTPAPPPPSTKDSMPPED